MKANNKKSKISIHELLLNPNPKEKIKHDLYEFCQSAERIKGYLEMVKSPYTIGIYGGWGSGKTTLKNFIIEKIEEDSSKKICPVDFNAWQYEQQTGILIPLLSKLVKMAGFEPSKFKKLFSVFSMSLSDIFLKLATGSLLSVKDVTDFEKYADENFFKYSKYIDKVAEAKKEFQDLISQIIKKKEKEKTVIFIDELDRCNPENAIKLLESIKNFFNVDGCIFVILVDDEILTSYIDKKYEETKMDGYMYLDKIVNTKFGIPKIPQDKIKNLSREFDTDERFFSLSSKFNNARKISRIYEKIQLYNEGMEKFENNQRNLIEPKILPHEMKGSETKVCYYTTILLYEGYPKLYISLDGANQGFWRDLEAEIERYRSGRTEGGHEAIRRNLGLEPDEMKFLQHFFSIFKDFNHFMKYNYVLKELQII